MLGFHLTLLLLLSEGLFSLKPPHALNKPPSVPSYNVCFNLKMTKAAAGGAQPELCVSSLHQSSFLPHLLSHNEFVVF